MDNLFLILILISLFCFLLGLIKPSIFQKIFKQNSTRKKLSLYFGITFIASFILFGIFPPSDELKPSADIESTNDKNVSVPIKEQSSQEILSTNIINLLQNSARNNMSYKDLKIEQSDSDRPIDTQMITVSVDVKSFLNKNTFIKDTGKISSLIFKEVYKLEEIKAYDVIVWFYGETTDRYGVKSNTVIQTYLINKETYKKINWDNFDETKLCDFLNTEYTSVNDSSNSCRTLVNIL